MYFSIKRHPIASNEFLKYLVQQMYKRIEIQLRRSRTET